MNLFTVMASDRLKQLQEFYDEDPADPFNLYALALEYLKHDPSLSGKFFQELLDNHPRYLPTYYHAAKLYAESGEQEKAIKVFESGIALATQLNDNKARRELKSAYDELMF